MESIGQLWITLETLGQSRTRAQDGIRGHLVRACNLSARGTGRTTRQSSCTRYQIKCKVHWETSGPRYEQIRKMATSVTRQFPGKAAVVCVVEEIFQGNGGDMASKKLG
ncbi:MAG: hypothetical protein NTY03_06945 [Candidatus Bathyarchaeota archaeon]|nr:hypothetical protein [Candidatus Bathyarchaeota archaeon]